MTQLLISVKNVEESLEARYAGADVIDLKDPENGALGALDTEIVGQILAQLKDNAFVSATVGEAHESVAALARDIQVYASLGVDVVKLSVSELFLQEAFFMEMRKLTSQGIKLVAVFFAENTIDLTLIKELKRCGFYGAMIDTQNKTKSLLETQSSEVLNAFTMQCKQLQLISGLAGSVNKSHIDRLIQFKPDFIGMRGGVCRKKERTATLLQDKIVEVNRMLLNYNTGKGLSGNASHASLHI